MEQRVADDHSGQGEDPQLRARVTPMRQSVSWMCKGEDKCK